MKKSIAVLGLGEYGRSLVRALNEMGADVLAADRNEESVNTVADQCVAAICTDLENEENLLTLGLQGMDIVVVSMGRNLEASILAVAVAKELGVPLIVAKSSSARMSSILRKVGANRIIVPEEYAGMRSASMLVSDAVMDYFQIDSNLCIIEMEPLTEWVGKSQIELNAQNKFPVNVIAKKNEDNAWELVDLNQPMKEGAKLLVVLERKDLSKVEK
ncbi:MAG: TrkA family potassium uptake protein [Clostridia bacterium]|nr:TrkA family potassium uptake protein [Clostridia bacterium]